MTATLTDEEFRALKRVIEHYYDDERRDFDGMWDTHPDLCSNDAEWLNHIIHPLNRLREAVERAEQPQSVTVCVEPSRA